MKATTINIAGNDLNVDGLSKESIKALIRFSKEVRDEVDGYSLAMQAKDYCDNTLKASEIMEIFYENFPTAFKDKQITREEAKGLKEQQKEIKEQEKEQEEQRIMNEWKKQKLSAINLPSFVVPKSLLGILLNSENIFGLLLEGKNGLGKSYSMMAEMQEIAKTKKVDYEVITGQITPLGIYQKMYDLNYKIKSGSLQAFNVLLDDTAGLFKSEIAVNILKGALWANGGKRILTYKSNHKSMEDYPEMFEMDSRLKITIITNRFSDKDENIAALKGRCFYHKFEFSYAEVIELMDNIVKQDYANTTLEERKEVLQFLKEGTNPATKNLNFRLLVKGFEFLKADNWKELLTSQIEQDESKQLVWELENNKQFKDMPVADKIQHFRDITGYSKRTYQNIKKDMGLTRKYRGDKQ